MRLQANLPAAPLVAHGGEVELGAGTDVATFERVYAADRFDPSASLLDGQTADQYLIAPAPATSTRVTGLSTPDGTQVVVVYTDSRGGLQYTSPRDSPMAWEDEGLIGGTTFYYRVVATRETTGSRGGILRSMPSEAVAGRAVDQTPPSPPAWTQAEWLVGADGSSFVRLEWGVSQPGLRCVLQRRSGNEISWHAITSWASEAERRGETFIFRHDDATAKAQRDNTYRVKVVSAAGTNAVFNEAYVAPSAVS
jgi:hypothetical protein